MRLRDEKPPTLQEDIMRKVCIRVIEMGTH